MTSAHREKEIVMPLRLPEGKRLAVSFGTDFDAHSAWLGSFDKRTPGYLSRGQFDAEVGVPRLLALYAKYGVKTTFFTPGHTMATFPQQIEAILAHGHEIGAHGLYHENITLLSPEEEDRVMEAAIALHEKHVGKRPIGFRSPAWDFSDATYSVLKKWDFKYDSSLMGRDFQAYLPRPVNIDLENGDTFGDPWQIVEFPVSWFLDDFPQLEFIPGIVHGAFDIDQLVKMWKTQFDYAYANEPGGVFCLTVHPGTIGRAHHIVAYEEFIKYVVSHEEAWVAPLADIYRTWNF
jgi:peptidoglycan/xylan/chitin deacetylase (PgdA/CDA1 family)